MISLTKKFIGSERGQDLVESAPLLVFIVLAAIAVLPTLGSAVNNVFSFNRQARSQVHNARRHAPQKLDAGAVMKETKATQMKC